MNPNQPKQNIAKKMPQPSFLQGLGGAFPQYRDQLQGAGQAIGNGIKAVGNFAQGIKNTIAAKMAPKIQDQVSQPNPVPKANPVYTQLAPPPSVPTSPDIFGQSGAFGPADSGHVLQDYSVNYPNGNKKFYEYNVPSGGFPFSSSLDDSTRRIKADLTYPGGSPIMIKQGQPLYDDFQDMRTKIYSSPPEPYLDEPTESNGPRTFKWAMLNRQVIPGDAAKSQQLPVPQETINQANMTYDKDTTDPDGTFHAKGEFMNPQLKQWIDYVMNQSGGAQQINSVYDERP